MSEVSKKFKVGDKVKITSLQSKRNRGDCELVIFTLSPSLNLLLISFLYTLEILITTSPY